MYKYINRTDEIWDKILPLLPKDNNKKEEEKLILINSVFYLQDCKRKNNEEKYSLQLHWDRLENNIDNILLPKENIVKEKGSIDNNTLRKKFDDWRNKGIWERLLPIFAESSTYCWITKEGRYEVFLICSSFIRDKNKERIKDIKHQCKEKYKDKIKEIRQENIDLKNSNKYLKKRIQELNRTSKNGQ